ncbi:MAG: TorF family putative porin, partial [Burkholderiales bacterium]
MKKTLVALSLAAMTLPALAQDKKAPEPDYTITGNFGLFSDYRFRGISQTDKKMAAQGGFDFAHKSGVYLGT